MKKTLLISMMILSLNGCSENDKNNIYSEDPFVNTLMSKHIKVNDSFSITQEEATVCIETHSKELTAEAKTILLENYDALIVAPMKKGTRKEAKAKSLAILKADPKLAAVFIIFSKKILIPCFAKYRKSK